MLRVAEVDHDISGHGETFVVSHLRSPIPGQRFIQFLWQLARMPDESIGDDLAILAGDLDQHHVACLALDERHNLAACAAAQEITFPVAGVDSIKSDSVALIILSLRVRMMQRREKLPQIQAVTGNEIKVSPTAYEMPAPTTREHALQEPSFMSLPERSSQWRLSAMRSCLRIAGMVERSESRP
ncbi:hypothetical protein BN2476_940005 [Paraburkholderia piptadeniae]|uniref:Uncharacterized protein n=1 Tax=Paraburkholderia piptadeniae TaxID=1701573 RepID=A0A1N7STQ7_9BURK|nr:hypothetical protein BN2476_940005 [Paraburkholderia piptadeniae]